MGIEAYLRHSVSESSMTDATEAWGQRRALLYVFFSHHQSSKTNCAERRRRRRGLDLHLAKLSAKAAGKERSRSRAKFDPGCFISFFFGTKKILSSAGRLPVVKKYPPPSPSLLFGCFQKREQPWRSPLILDEFLMTGGDGGGGEKLAPSPFFQTFYGVPKALPPFKPPPPQISPLPDWMNFRLVALFFLP